MGSGWNSNEKNQKYVADIWANIKASKDYPFIGDAKGRFRQQWQLGINCVEVVAPGRCGNPKERVGAYVIQASGEQGPQMTVCPDIFDTK